MDMIALRAAIGRDDMLATAHAQAEATMDGLHIDEIWASILDASAEVIEDYPSGPRGPSCLILGSVLGQPIHSVIAFHRSGMRRSATFRPSRS